MSSAELIPIGRVTGVHGIKGEVKLAPYGSLDGVEWGTVCLSSGAKKAQRRVKRARLHKGVWLLELEGTSDRNSAEELVGSEILIERSELPDTGPDEYYYFDLVGMEVWAEDGRLIGTVREIIATGSNDVLSVDGPFGEVLIPAIDEVVRKVDPGASRITIRLMEGLLPD